MTVAIALFTSRGWIEAAGAADDGCCAAWRPDDGARLHADSRRRGDAPHGAGLAIPDFPLMFGGLVPDHWERDRDPLRAPRRRAARHGSGPGHHGSHLVPPRGPRELTRPALLHRRPRGGAGHARRADGAEPRDVAINSAHVVCGALVLATSLVITLRSWRVRFARSG
jgi:hypothetical protein